MPITVVRFWSDQTKARQIFGKLEFDLELQNIPVTLYECDSRNKWCVEALFQNVTEKSIRDILSKKIGISDSSAFELEELIEKDWVANGLENLKPVRAGRFYIYGSHDSGNVPVNVVPIQIDAAQAFGTGHHETTVGCLREIDRLFKRRIYVHGLDIGTGSGILAIAIARQAKIPVLATDIDPIAVDTAKQNSKINQVQSLVKLYCANGISYRMIRENYPYDLIVANILANPLVSMAGAISKILAKNGVLVLSGLLESDGSRIISSYVSHGLRLVNRNCHNGWLTLTFTNSRTDL